MAAVQWSDGKMHGATEAKSSMMHDDKQMRMIHDHANPDIDIAKTPGNFSYRNLSYREKCQRYDGLMQMVRIKRVSSGKNANVTLQKLVIPIPPEMQRGDKYDPVQVKAWVHDVGTVLDDEYGDLLIDIDCHVDEIHQYLNPRKAPDDPDRYMWSRIHLHAAVVPAIHEAIKDKDGNPVCDNDGEPLTELVLNSFKFSKKRNIIRLNEKIHKMTKEKYGMDFMTGTGIGQQHNRVEDLKSWTAEAMRDEGLQLASKGGAYDAPNSMGGVSSGGDVQAPDSVPSTSHAQDESEALDAMRPNTHDSTTKTADAAQAEADKLVADAQARANEIKQLAVLQARAVVAGMRARYDLEAQEKKKEQDEEEKRLEDLRQQVIEDTFRLRNERNDIRYEREKLMADQRELRESQDAACDMLLRASSQMRQAMDIEFATNAKLNELKDRESRLAAREAATETVFPRKTRQLPDLSRIQYQ